MEEIGILAGNREVQKNDPSRLGSTHSISENETSLLLMYKNDKLMSIQVMWLHKISRSAYYPPREVCLSPREQLDKYSREMKKQEEFLSSKNFD